MPQDGLKSVIYRSFVTCDDPKGVVTCGTIRKSKTDYSLSKRKEKIEENKREIIGRRKPKKSLSESSDYHYNPEVEEITMRSRGEEIHNLNHNHNHSPSSFQLMEVSRGAQRLNNMIESWSKGVKFEGQSKDIAKDLLKGALDLQDSLIMLGKLQEASNYMAHLKKKQIMESSERRGYDDDHHYHYRHDHDHYHYHHDHLRDKYPITGFQMPRNSFDGSSSRNSTEELKKVIRESLVSQSFLSQARIKHERACFAHRSLESASTSDQSPTAASSSQSSLALPPVTESPTASSSSSVAAHQTAKGPNLIAKLMGLEEHPLKPLQATSQRGFEGHSKISSERRPVFDIDMPKARKPQYQVRKADPERKTLKEILDTMQFKGLLRSNAAKGDHTNASYFKQRYVEDGPPIVLIKPLRIPSVEMEETQKQTQTNTSLLEEEDPLYRRKMLRKLRGKEELQPKEISCKEVNLKSDILTQRNLEAKGIPSEGLKEQRVIVEVPEEKEVVVKENSSVNLRASRPVNRKTQRTEAVEKRADKIQKVTNINRRAPPLEKEVVKTKSVPPKSEDQAKKLSTKAGRSNSVSNIVKSQSSRRLSTKPSAIKHGEQNAACNSAFQKKNRSKKEKPGKKPGAAKSVTEISGLEEGENEIKVTNESDYHEVTIEINPENHEVKEQLPKKEDLDIFDSKIDERCSDSRSSPCDATPSTPCPDIEICREITEHIPKDISICTRTDENSFKSETGLRALLLSSLSFQNHVEELFDLNTNCSGILQTSYTNIFGDSSTSLSLDCAKELVERKSLQDSQTFGPLIPTCAGKLRCRSSVFLEMLVEEVCRGIEAVMKYSKLGGASLVAVDGLYAMLEADLACNGFESGIWDFGWKTGISWDEAEQVVNDIEKLVLSGLIEEVFT